MPDLPEHHRVKGGIGEDGVFLLPGLRGWRDRVPFYRAQGAPDPPDDARPRSGHRIKTL